MCCPLFMTTGAQVRSSSDNFDTITCRPILFSGKRPKTFCIRSLFTFFSPSKIFAGFLQRHVPNPNRSTGTKHGQSTKRQSYQQTTTTTTTTTTTVTLTHCWIVDMTGKPRSTAFLFKRLGVSIQRGNMPLPLQELRPRRQNLRYFVLGNWLVTSSLCLGHC